MALPIPQGGGNISPGEIMTLSRFYETVKICGAIMAYKKSKQWIGYTHYYGLRRHLLRPYSIIMRS